MTFHVFTWRIGKSSQDDVEKSIEYFDVMGMAQLRETFESVFLLETCQRLLIAVNGNPNSLDRLVKQGGLSPPEIYIGGEALIHLLNVVSSLDSIVVGEDQILHQFRVAYEVSEPFMDGFLKRIMQGVIRAGKRVRARTMLGGLRKSTISVVVDNFARELNDAKNIAIIGSGKMAMLITESLQEMSSKISIYSRSNSRVDLEINGIKIQAFSSFSNADIVFIASSQGLKLGLHDLAILDWNCIIFDFGMPRQTEEEIGSYFKDVYTLEDLMKLSREKVPNEIIDNIHAILEREKVQIEREIRRLETSHIWQELRYSLTSIAHNDKNLFIANNPKAEREFQRFLKKILHVTQKKIEEVIITK